MVEARWLGTVSYREAERLQRRLFAGSCDYLLLLEHPHVYTMGIRDSSVHVLVDPAAVGAQLVQTDRGGDITYHGPGQLVGYPILTLPRELDSTRAYVGFIEDVLIHVAGRFGVTAERIEGCPGVWVRRGPVAAKLAAIGVRRSRGRTMHGFALNVDTDLDMFAHIVPCGITDKTVTSLRALGVEASMREVVDAVVEEFSHGLGSPINRSDVVFRVPLDDTDLAPFSATGLPAAHIKYRTDPAAVSVQLNRRRAQAGVSEAVDIRTPKPPWMRARLDINSAVRHTAEIVKRHGLVTVCQEAGCPNLSECWSEGTATFMVGGDRCTRKCGFCLVDTRLPAALDPAEPESVARAAQEMGLTHTVVTMVARDDLPDGAAGHVAATIAALRTTGCSVEVLISDLGGDEEALRVVLEASPAVVNHNIETVARLQRVARPQASYARSLALLATASAAPVLVKSGIVVGMGETDAEIRSTLIDLAAVGVQVVTIGQYLRPTAAHLPVERWWEPEQFDVWKAFGEHDLGFAHVESSPLTRSSFHAGAALQSALAMRS